MEKLIIEFSSYAIFLFAMLFIGWLIYGSLKTSLKRDNWWNNHEHDFCIPVNNKRLNLMKCKYCNLHDDVTDHTNYKLEKAISEYERVHDIYVHNKPLWGLSEDLRRRMTIIVDGNLPYKFKKELYYHLKQQNDNLLFLNLP